MPRNTEEDYEVMLIRLSKVSFKIDQIIQLMEYGVMKNTTNHATSMVSKLNFNERLFDLCNKPIRRPPNLSELTPMIFNTGLTQLGSEAPI